MKLSILHIADIHRDPGNPIRTKPLFDSLERDRQRFTSEEKTPSIRPPDIIVVSGDVIHGVKSNSTNADDELAKQYGEALRFLNQLAERFVDGDKRKIVVVPGNHDVSAFHFEQSLQELPIVEDRKKKFVSQLFSQNSALRWSWPNFKLYQITDYEMYNKRLSAFSQFYKEFYEDERAYDLEPARQYDIFDYPELNVTFVAFNSCYNNDIFNKQGAIHPDCIANASEKLHLSLYQDRLRIAVWHHNTEGLPMEVDYMAPDTIQNLIDRGFSLGLHGHRHKPQFIDRRFQYGGERKIITISAGTLCGGAAFRFRRAYNVIELDLDELKGRLHLREMQNDALDLPIWGKGALPPNISSFMEFSFDPPPEPLVRSSTDTLSLVRAQKLYDEKRYDEAAIIFKSLTDSDDLARRFLLDCYGKSNDSAAIVADFDPPQSNTEIISLMDALWTEGKQDRLRDLLNESIVADSLDPSIIEIRNKYIARLKI
ncbi:metallophosphoesterase [bacterium]|nr:metallophosphoesterase [bacterium]